MYIVLFVEAVTSLSLTRDGQCMLVSTLDSTVKLIDKDSGEMLNEYTGHKNDSYKVHDPSIKFVVRVSVCANMNNAF